MLVLVRCPSAEVELAADALWAAGAAAVEEVAAGVVADVDPSLLGSDLAWEPAEVEPGWADAWRAHARAERTGRVVVVPTWVAPPPPRPDDVLVVLEPGTAFGAGGHATTRLVLAALQDVVRPGASVLDVGSGSGVLAAAAAALGAEPVVAVDVAPEAVTATTETAAASGVHLTTHLGSADHPALAGVAFDVVCANLLGPVVRDLAPHLAARTRPGGHLLVSGLLATAWTSTLEALDGPFALEARDELDGWVGLRLRRRS